MISLVFLSFVTYLIPVGDHATRVTLAASLVLTAGVFKFAVISFMPPVACLTLLDKFILWCSMLSVWCTLIHSASGNAETAMQWIYFGMCGQTLLLAVAMHSLYQGASTAFLKDPVQIARSNIREERKAGWGSKTRRFSAQAPEATNFLKFLAKNSRVSMLRDHGEGKPAKGTVEQLQPAGGANTAGVGYQRLSA
mmetsp:Transcript_16046/g.40674  ORF Transcript_16046/g.40674 Transcript_16046/m.40674 type:complete len:195 (-) Transcript_16046:147-731(-)